MPDTRLRQRASLAVIRLARRVLANTPVHSLPVVSWAYRKTVRMTWGGADVEAQFRGLRLTVPSGDHILAAGVAGGYYESIELDLLERLAATGTTILDVGANIGIHSCVGAAALPEGGQLIAFEPVPGNLAALRRNIDQNDLADRIRVEELAIGETDGEMRINLAELSVNHSLVAEVVGNSRASLPVRVTSLDKYVATHTPTTTIDVLKIDVEGYDGYALRGANTVLTKHQPALLVEFVPSDLAKAGFAPTEFLDLVFDCYQQVYVIDEPRRRLSACTVADLRRYGERSVNLNLLAARRPEHVAIIESYRTELPSRP
jgi:FkbM family methyltransferase